MTVLYTPEILGLTMALFNFPLDETVPLRAGARSRSCGSTLDLGLDVDEGGQIRAVGLRCQACAIGQASAAIFAGSAAGRSSETVLAVASALESWLANEGPLPDWPGLQALVPAREYPARHGAVMLVWNAAVQILTSQQAAH